MNEKPLPASHCPDNMRITESVPMAHVADVDKSLEFYALLGFNCESRFSSDTGETNWAAVTSGKARLFLARASGAIVPSEQAVLFYMYSKDVVGLRKYLLGKGLGDAGNPPDEKRVELSEIAKANNVVFRIVPRFYMPMGELRIQDPDGYVILVGQLG